VSTRATRLRGNLLASRRVTHWEWDPSLYGGSAAYYARGRLPYPRELADALRDALELDGRGRLLDVGCGPGSLTHLLAPLVQEAVGIDADAEMVRAAEAGAAPNERFVQLRAEALPAGLGTFRLVTFAQSFHWLDGVSVATKVRAMLEPNGAVVHIGATTHEGDGDVPREAIEELIRSYLGPMRRAGRRVLPQGTQSDEDDAFAAAGLRGPMRIEVAAGRLFDRDEDDVVASVFSLSSAAPHLFGERLGEFERDLRALLHEASPTGRFYERARPITLRIWR
jgi:SAM-dependent methyltransferase